jgi:6-phosphogluconolactonase (cycloisomerase 2 family)
MKFISFTLLIVALPLFAQDGADAIYVQTNTAENAVNVYRHTGDGLRMDGSYKTRGAGTGSGLGSQGAVTLSPDGRFLAAVNAASNEVTLFATTPQGLEFRGKTNSGGEMPISVTINGDLLFVVNAGGAPNIAGFRFNRRGVIEPLAGGTRNLSGGGPAEISFNEDGTILAVTLKASNTIDLFRVDDGLVSGPFTAASQGQTPFGFLFDRRDHLLVTEAVGATPGATTVSSYDVSELGTLSVVTRSLRSGQTAACWIAVTPNGKFAFAANTPSNSLTTYRLTRNGALTLREPSGASAIMPAGSGPTDMGVSQNNRFLYVLRGGSGEVSVYRLSGDGALSFVDTLPGLTPGAAAGLALQ